MQRRFDSASSFLSFFSFFYPFHISNSLLWKRDNNNNCRLVTLDRLKNTINVMRLVRSHMF